MLQTVLNKEDKTINTPIRLLGVFSYRFKDEVRF